MESIFFISDAHLGAHLGNLEHAKVSRLISFLGSIEGKADYLYIVGDLYDFWFEYRTAIPKVNLRLLAKLMQLVDQGTKVRYLTGNHDLWHETYIAEQTGIEVFHEAMEVEHNALKLFVAHGDGLTPGQRKLRFVKRILRNRTNIFLYKLIHPDFGIPLAGFFSHKSKQKGLNKYVAEFQSFARGKLADGFDAVILGHTHQPAIEKMGRGYYINLGDWVDSFTYLQLTDKKFSLKNWPGNPS